MTANTETPQNAARKLTQNHINKGYTLAALHEYQHASGAPSHWRIRLNPPAGSDQKKLILPMHFDGANFVLKEPKFSGKKPLYRLPVIAGNAEPVMIVEGEKDADALANLGVQSTTSGGASSADAADLTPLAGRECVIFRDYDEPGLRYAQQFTSKLMALNCTVRLVDVAALGMLEKDGAFDWLALHPDATAADVWALPTIEPIAPSLSSVLAVPPKAHNWPEPKPLPEGLPDVEPFDLELLPEALRAFVADAAHRMDCPPDFIAVPLMIAAGSVIGRSVCVRPKRHDNWTIVPNLWGCIVGRPSSTKSPALDQAIAPLRMLESQARSKHTEAVTEWKGRKTLADIDSSKAKSEIKKARNDLERMELAMQLNAAEDEPAPVEKRYSTSDATVEKIGELLAVNDRGILTVRDELVGFLRGMDRDGQEGARSFYLESFNGTGGFTYDRIGRGTVHIEACCTSIVGSVQPGPLLEFVRQTTAGGAGDDGFLPRFQMAVWPDQKKDFRFVDRWPDSDARKAVNSVFVRLAAMQHESVGATLGEFDQLPWLRFDDEGAAEFEIWWTAQLNTARAGELHETLCAWLAKSAKTCASLALIYHLANGGTGPIPKHCVEIGCAWVDYLFSHAKRLYAPAIQGDALSARTLAAKLKAGKLENGFTAREARRKGWTGLTSVDAVDDALGMLVELGWLTDYLEDTGGRPTTVFKINPRIAEVAL